MTKPMGENYFELSIPPFLGLHIVFGVELLQPCFPPLLDTSKDDSDHLAPIEINPYYIEHAIVD